MVKQAHTAKIAALEARIDALQTKMGKSVRSHFWLNLHSYRPGQHTLTIGVQARVPGPSDGLQATPAGEYITKTGKEVEKERGILEHHLHNLMQNEPYEWGLMSEEAHTKFQWNTSMSQGGEPRYFQKSNLITQTTYIELKFRNPEDFNLDAFRKRLMAVGKNLGVKVK